MEAAFGGDGLGQERLAGARRPVEEDAGTFEAAGHQLGMLQRQLDRVEQLPDDALQAADVLPAHLGDRRRVHALTLPAAHRICHTPKNHNLILDQFGMRWGNKNKSSVRPVLVPLDELLELEKAGLPMAWSRDGLLMIVDPVVAASCFAVCLSAEKHWLSSTGSKEFRNKTDTTDEARLFRK